MLQMMAVAEPTGDLARFLLMYGQSAFDVECLRQIERAAGASTPRDPSGADPMAHHTSDDLLQLPTMEASELSTHDGSGATGPYVAVLGAVYDMSSSANFYGPGGKHRLAPAEKVCPSLA